MHAEQFDAFAKQALIAAYHGFLHLRLLRSEGIEVQAEKNPFRNYEGGLRVYIDTPALIKALWSMTLGEPFHETSCQANWQDKVDRWCAESEAKYTL